MKILKNLKGVFKSHTLNIIKFISISWLIFLLIFSFGYISAHKSIFPSNLINKVLAYYKGGAGEGTTLLEKIINDLGIKPTRHIFDYLSQSNNLEKIDGLPLNPERDLPEYYLSANAPRGYRLIQGAMDYDTHLHGMFLIGPNGDIIKHWKLSQENADWKTNNDQNSFQHGVQMDRDGSFVINFDFSNVLTKYNYCGEKVWDLKGDFHHSITFENDKKSIWVSGAKTEDKFSKEKYIFTKVNYKTGEILDMLSFKEVLEKNADIDIFGLNQVDLEKHSEYIQDPFHINDIDPLTPEIAQNYKNFEAGDFLLSFRNLNLVFVLDRDTNKIKWWRQGRVRRQHDPDWNENGKISVYNNRTFRGFSNIVEIDPINYRSNILLNGEDYDFYSKVRGKHQILEDGGILVSSPRQGRALEINKEGDVVFEFVNYYDKENSKVLSISEAIFFPEDYFTNLPDCV